MSHGVLKEMLEIYKPNGVDWMGYKVSKKNPYTFHHIQERRNGGRNEVNNGAILTKKAHAYLNYLEQFCPMAYDEYQAIFRLINSFNGPIPSEMYDEIYAKINALADDIKKGERFTFLKEPKEFNTEKDQNVKKKCKSKR